MGRIFVTEFVSLDGVFEEPHEWHFPFFNEQAAGYKAQELRDTEALLLGRVTYEGFAAAWPERSGDEFSDTFNSMPKYVVSSTLQDLSWNNSHMLAGDLSTEVAALKERHDGAIAIHGSGTLANAMLREGLLDEVRLMVHPIVVGQGRRRFLADDTSIDALTLTNVERYDSGILMLTYEPQRTP